MILSFWIQEILEEHSVYNFNGLGPVAAHRVTEKGKSSKHTLKTHCERAGIPAERSTDHFNARLVPVSRSFPIINIVAHCTNQHSFVPLMISDNCLQRRIFEMDDLICNLSKMLKQMMYFHQRFCGRFYWQRQRRIATSFFGSTRTQIFWRTKRQRGEYVYACVCVCSTFCPGDIGLRSWMYQNCGYYLYYFVFVRFWNQGAEITSNKRFCCDSINKI